MEWRSTIFFHAYDLALCGETKEDLKMMAKQFVDVCRRGGLKVNADKRKLMVLEGGG